MIISFARYIVTKTVVAKICKLSEFKSSGVACRFPGCAVTQNKEFRVVHTTPESGTESVPLRTTVRTGRRCCQGVIHFTSS